MFKIMCTFWDKQSIAFCCGAVLVPLSPLGRVDFSPLLRCCLPAHCPLPLLSNLVWTACCRCFSPGSLYSIHKLYQSNSYSRLDHPPYSHILPTNNHIVVCCSWWGRKGRFCIEWSSWSVPRRHCCCILFIYCCSQYDNATIHCSHPIELFPLPPSIFTLRVYPPQLRPCCCGSSARIPSVLFPLLSLCYLLHSNTKLLDHIRNDYDYPLCHNGCC